MKALQIMPSDIRTSSLVQSVLKDLEDEMETWTSFGAEEPSLVEQQQQFQKQTIDAARGRSNGPVDVDAVVAEDGALDSGEGGALSGGEEEQKPRKAKSSTRPKEEPKDVDDPIDDEEPTSPSKNPSQTKKYNKEDLKKVTFEDGSIGMQLEPTADDSGCRVCGFLDGPDGSPSPAKASGKIVVGDVIVKVNSTKVRSYDATIEVLKAGGRRKITFRPALPEDTQYNLKVDTGGDSDGSEDKKEKKNRHHSQPSPAKKDQSREKDEEGTVGDSDKEKKLKKLKKEKKEKKEKKREQ